MTQSTDAGRITWKQLIYTSPKKTENTLEIMNNGNLLSQIFYGKKDTNWNWESVRKLHINKWLTNMQINKSQRY